MTDGKSENYIRQIVVLVLSPFMVASDWIITTVVAIAHLLNGNADDAMETCKAFMDRWKRFFEG